MWNNACESRFVKQNTLEIFRKYYFCMHICTYHNKITSKLSPFYYFHKIHWIIFVKLRFFFIHCKKSNRKDCSKIRWQFRFRYLFFIFHVTDKQQNLHLTEKPQSTAQ